VDGTSLGKTDLNNDDHAGTETIGVRIPTMFEPGTPVSHSVAASVWVDTSVCGSSPTGSFTLTEYSIDVSGIS
jgi:hypothetical protein